ncbi:MAG: carbon-nitrogen hydrolase family protein [Deltaproteobacteria bacterium]|nr:carbon-nitrogen hydrolase family protein [Deltaproteobacteria bacterium]
MNSQDNKGENLASAERLIDELAKRQPRLIMLPEYFNFLGPDDRKAENAEPVDDSPSIQIIRNKAMEHRVYIHLGSFLERADNRVFNTAMVFNPDGDLVAKYKKIHLFDVEIPGGLTYLESQTMTAGSEVVTFTIDDVVFGMSTCYDLRFPELFRRLAERNVQVILLAAAFTLQTGRDHWELLLRARAVENLCWVGAAAQWGPHPNDNVCFGRSMIVNPWGLVVAQAPDGVSTLICDINMDLLKRTRATFPALLHRRKELFPV